MIRKTKRLIEIHYSASNEKKLVYLCFVFSYFVSVNSLARLLLLCSFALCCGSYFYMSILLFSQLTSCGQEFPFNGAINWLFFSLLSDQKLSLIIMLCMLCCPRDYIPSLSLVGVISEQKSHQIFRELFCSA